MIKNARIGGSGVVFIDCYAIKIKVNRSRLFRLIIQGI